MKRKICVVTATRAEFGLLYWIIKELHENNSVELQLIVTGMHLSPEFGLTYSEIELSGFPVTKKVEILLSSDTPVGVSKSMGLALISFTEIFTELEPDLLLLLGDRFEMLSVASAALVSKIPIAHIHGGETTIGAIDESIRHAITKMSHLHFSTTDTYRDRIIQLGENPKRVFNFGAPGLDNLTNLVFLDKDDIEERIKFTLGNTSALVTFHPETLVNLEIEDQFSQILDALSLNPNIRVIFTKANADVGGRLINKMIDDYVSKNSNRCICFASMGQLLFLSTIRLVDLVIGNSSSGIIEAPSLNTITINIGDRQKGRVKALSVIDCKPITEDINRAILVALSMKAKFKKLNINNPYFKKDSSKNIAKVLCDIPLCNLIKKDFFDLPINFEPYR